MYQAVKERSEPLTIPRLLLDTGTKSLDECVQMALAYLLSRSFPAG